MYDEHIKARLLKVHILFILFIFIIFLPNKEIRYYREHQFDPEVDQKVKYFHIWVCL